MLSIEKTKEVFQSMQERYEEMKENGDKGIFPTKQAFKELKEDVMEFNCTMQDVMFIADEHPEFFTVEDIEAISSLFNDSDKLWDDMV
jgi:hypothetical protein